MNEPTKPAAPKKTQRTPGPWNVQGRHQTEVSGPAGTHIICDLGGGGAPSEEIFEAAQADARLIAQAPAMLDALREALRVLDDDTQPVGTAKQMIRAILAAVEGKS